jgi:hypothetical protein
MAIVVKFAVNNMPADKYDDVIRRLEAAGAGAPAGRLYHTAYGTQDAIQVIDVYDSPESLNAFGAALMPILQELGIEAVPDIQPIHNTIQG